MPFEVERDGLKMSFYRFIIFIDAKTVIQTDDNVTAVDHSRDHVVYDNVAHAVLSYKGIYGAITK